MKVNITVDLLNDEGKALAVGDRVLIRTKNIEGLGVIKSIQLKFLSVRMEDGNSYTVLYKNIIELI